MNFNAATVTRQNDVFTLVDTITWTSSNAWQDLFTPAVGEGGEIWLMFTAADSKKYFQKFGYVKSDSSTITCATSGTVGIIALGNATYYPKLQNSSGTIQIAHTGSAVTCSCKYRKIVNVA
mgnify:CR=1 FL=1